MKKLKILLMNVFILFLILGFSNVVHAEGDVLDVTVDNSSFSVSKDNVTVGDIVKISVDIKANTTNPWKTVTISFTKPVTLAESNSYYLTYNSTTGLYETDLLIDNNWQNGTYIIERIYFSDGTNFISRYNSKNPNALWYGFNDEHSIDLSGCSFCVYGTTADAELPQIYGSSLEMSTRQVMNGDTIKYSVKITDNVSVESASIHLIWNNETGSGLRWDFKTINLTYNPKAGVYEGNLTIDSNLKMGFWQIYYIAASDSNDNYICMYNNAETTATPNYNWSSTIYSFYNYGENPDSEFTLNSLSVDNDLVTGGEQVNISLQAMNYFGIDGVKLFYKKNNIDELYIVDAIFDSVETTGSSNGIQYYYNIYKATLDFNLYGYNGEWVIDKIEITSKRNNVTTIYNSQLHEDVETDLSSGNFETYGLIDDSIAPTISSYEIDKNIINYGDIINLSISASDDSSGIQSVIANYTLPNKSAKDYFLKYDSNENNYKYIFEFNAQENSGKYIINYILLEDKAGNITKITNDISELSFNFDSPIKIVSPAQYLNTTTTYRMKAVISSKAITDVIWTSTNPSIASINSTTGVLSTKSTEGNFSVIATAADGSGIYGKIDLVVTNVHIKVGESTSIGNSSYTTYSEVEWKIEDESILGKTGSYGTISINNYYKHSIEVKGLKEGITTIGMYTPSGDMLLSSKVYVYNPVTKLNSNIENLRMKKDENKNLVISALSNESLPCDATIIYESENKDVVTVDSNGKVTAVGYGTTNINIYYQYEGISLTIPVIVSIYIEDMTLNPESCTIKKGSNQDIIASIIPDDAMNKILTWSSSDTNVATVDANGVVTAKAKGTATITAKTNDGSDISKTCYITVKDTDLPYIDVTYDNWYYSAVEFVHNNNYMTGTTPNKVFSPNEKLTRAMLVTILHRMEGQPYQSGTSKFPDVQDTSAYYYVAVKWATANNIVSGYDNGNFGPNDLITREQLAVMLNSYCKYKGEYKSTIADYSKYRDSDKISEFAKWGMNWAVGSGVITGTNEGYLNPQGTATRAEAAAMLCKYCIREK